MLAKIALGAEMDILSASELADGLDGVVGKLRREPVPRPNYYTRAGTIVTNGTATNGNVLSMGSPPVGRIWDILGLTTAGLDDFTAVVGTVALYVGNHNTISMSDLRVPKFSIPAYDDIGPGRLWCMPTQVLYCTVNGAVTNQTVNILIQVAEWREKDVINGSTR